MTVDTTNAVYVEVFCPVGSKHMNQRRYPKMKRVFGVGQSKGKNTSLSLAVFRGWATVQQQEETDVSTR